MCSPTGIIDFCELELSGVLAIQKMDLPLGYISNALHPDASYRLIAPLAALYSFPLGRRLWKSYIIADVLNFILKVLCRADRPFWVSSAVEQFPHTCESGYGFPSGHCMAAASTLCCLPKMIPLQNVIVAGVLVALALSRVSTGSHFPSQAIVGVFCGFLITRVVDRVRSIHLAVLLVSVPLMYASMNAIGVDPLASFQLAVRGCKDPQGVSSTAPFLMRGMYVSSAMFVVLLLIKKDPQRAKPHGLLLFLTISIGSYFRLATIRHEIMQSILIGILSTVPAYVSCVV